MLSEKELAEIKKHAIEWKIKHILDLLTHIEEQKQEIERLREEVEDWKRTAQWRDEYNQLYKGEE